MNKMKYLLSVLALVSLAESSFAQQTIFMMDTIEFNTVRHDRGKRQYVERLTPILGQMRLQEGDFDAMKADSDTVYELIQQESRWTAILNEVERICQNKAQRKNCLALARLRRDTFEYISKHPQNYER